MRQRFGAFFFIPAALARFGARPRPLVPSRPLRLENTGKPSILAPLPPPRSSVDRATAS